MKLRLRGKKERFEIGGSPRSGRGGPRPVEEAAARHRAEQLALKERDPRAIGRMRKLLAREGVAAHRLSDQEVRAELARRLRRGALALTVRPIPLFAAEPQARVEEPEILEPTPIPEPEPAPEPEPEPVRTRPWRGDAAAQADTLKRAAEEGSLYCEICEKAKTQDSWPGDAAAQADTLKRAAEEGSLYCEICEKAEAERQAA